MHDVGAGTHRDEAGKRTGSTEVLQAIARALNLALDDIV